MGARGGHTDEGDINKWKANEGLGRPRVPLILNYEGGVDHANDMLMRELYAYWEVILDSLNFALLFKIGMGIKSKLDLLYTNKHADISPWKGSFANGHKDEVICLYVY